MPVALCSTHTQRDTHSGHRVQCDMTGILLRELLLASPPPSQQQQQWQIASSIHIDNINISSNARNLHLPLGLGMRQP